MESHAFAEVNGVRLHYVTAGTGKPIIFLHGFPDFWYLWKAQLDEFGRDHQVVAPDLRGYNLSSKPVAVEQYQLPHLVGDLRALAAHLGFTRFVLVGHDWGGIIAWAYAEAYPATLDRLIVINAAPLEVWRHELRTDPAQREASAYIASLDGPEGEADLALDSYWLLAYTVFEYETSPDTLSLFQRCSCGASRNHSWLRTS